MSTAIARPTDLSRIARNGGENIWNSALKAASSIMASVYRHAFRWFAPPRRFVLPHALAKLTDFSHKIMCNRATVAHNAQSGFALRRLAVPYRADVELDPPLIPRDDRGCRRRAL